MFEELLQEIESERQRVSDKAIIDPKKELAGNVYPMLARVVELIGQRLGETEEVVAAYLEGEDSLIQPDLGIQILGVFDLTKQLCAAILADPTYAPLQKGAEQLAVLVHETAETVDSFVLDEDDDDDEDEDDEDDEDEDEEEAQ
jgi:hypothetical protein